MGTVTDFYEELGLNRTSNIEEINLELTQLEKVWHQREMNLPEKARKYLSLLDEARSVFKSESTRNSYNRELEESRNREAIIDTDEDRKETAAKWFHEALQFTIDQQDDLAVEAIKRSLQYCREGDEGYDTILDRAADMYKRIGDYTTAFSCINKAIVANPKKLAFYKTRASIYWYIKHYMVEATDAGQSVSLEEYQTIVKKYRDEMYSILRKAEEENDQWEKVNAWDALSATLYWDKPRDITMGEQYANMVRDALKEQFGSNWENMFENQQAKFVLGDIEDEKKEFQGYQGASHPSSSSSGGCYIATAVYSSYDCPEVWVLRRYRDNILSNTWYGRLFIKLYYSISPTIVRCSKSKVWINKIWKNRLDRFVNKLKKMGFQDTPYFDK